MQSPIRKGQGLRISGGSLKGRIIPVPSGTIRPAMEKMRESLFAILGNLEGVSFLDLFSGSGIIALEAASRGAQYLEAVEADKGKLKTLISNTSLSPARIYCRSMSVELYIKRSKRSFDFIFCDPPFDYRYKNELILAIGNSSIMKEGSLLMIHHPKKETINLQDKNNNLIMQESKLYGNSAVDFFLMQNTQNKFARKLDSPGNN